MNNQRNFPYGYPQRENNMRDEIQFRNNISLQGNQPISEIQKM